MTSNNSTEYKIIADKIVSPDEDIIIQIAGDVYKNSFTAENRYVTAGEVGEGGSGLTGPTGPTGPQGEIGPTGPAGSGDSGPKTWTAPSESIYTITQEHGGIEVTTESRTSITTTYTVTGINAADFEIQVTGEDATMFSDYWNGNVHQRGIYFYGGVGDEVPLGFVSFFETEVGSGTYVVILRLPYEAPFNPGDLVDVNIRYGSPPVKWWGANDLVNDQDSGDFRGAKIDYHAFVSDGGTVIGTIYIARDSGDDNVTHIETTSGGSDSSTAQFWNRSGSESELYLYRTDGEGQTVRIHWTAQVYYSPEFYD